MTAPNNQITSLAKNFKDYNPDGILEALPAAPIAGAATGNQTIAANSGIVGGMFVHTPTANLTLTLDTAANLVTQCFGGIGSNGAVLANQGYFDYIVVNAGVTANTATTMAAGTGGTTSGNMTVPLSTSARFRCLFNSANSYTLYRAG